MTRRMTRYLLAISIEKLPSFLALTGPFSSSETWTSYLFILFTKKKTLENSQEQWSSCNEELCKDRRLHHAWIGAPGYYCSNLFLRLITNSVVTILPYSVSSLSSSFLSFNHPGSCWFSWLDKMDDWENCISMPFPPPVSCFFGWDLTNGPNLDNM